MGSFNIWNKIFLILLVISLLLIFFLPINDPDFGWHYRCGEQALTQHELCLSNNFSYFLSDYKWAYSDFTYDISLALIFDHFGFIGVSLLGSIIFTIIFLIFYFLLKGTPLLKITAIFLIILLSQNTFSLGYRSQILGLLFFALTLFFLKKNYIYLFPILFFFWANSHLSFFLGLLVLGAFLAEKIIRIIINNQLDFKKVLSYFSVFSLSALATCANPFGWRVYQEVINHFNAPLNTMIAEWVGPADWQKGLIIFTAIIMAAIYFAYKKVDYRFFLLIIFAWFAISARRNLPIYYLTLFYILFDFINFKIPKLYAIIVLIIAAVFWGVPNVPRTLTFSTDMKTYCRDNAIQLPCQAVEIMKDKTGNVFNTYEWGGFLIWQLPNTKVFIDGRMPAWKDGQGRYPYAVFLSIIQTQPGWNEELKKYGTDYLLIGNGTFLDLLLQEDSQKIYGWQEEYRDEVAVIYLKYDSR